MISSYHDSSRPCRHSAFILCATISGAEGSSPGPATQTCPALRFKESKDVAPSLILAPMEVLGNYQFRRAIASAVSLRGPDEMVTEFISVPDQGEPKGLVKRYNSKEVAPIPIAPQIMGSAEDKVAEMVRLLKKRGAHRVDLNCGCPAKGVNSKGAGSSLLKSSEYLYQTVKAMVNSGANIPITVKVRSGYDDISLFEDNLMAIQEAKASGITIHPRTRKQRYTGQADWSLIAKAKDILNIPVVGNGDVTSVEKAFKLLEETSCDGIMIGRGAVRNPWLFWEIRARFDNGRAQPNWDEINRFWNDYVHTAMDPSKKINQMKMIASWFFLKNEALYLHSEKILKSQEKDADLFLGMILEILEREVSSGRYYEYSDSIVHRRYG